LDTHALLWWLGDDPSLGKRARSAIADKSNGVIVSAASAWEIAIKFRLGRLPDASELLSGFADQMRVQGFDPLAISVEHAIRAGLLPGKHRDPFDRMLIAQAQAEDLTLVSNETLFDGYGVRRIW
jgi:PIN domain nuclease of toxin-antitoxin system